MRQLLDSARTAEKLGLTLDTFYRRRPDLYRRGFPRPVFGDRAFGHARYDEKAIDLWLDQQLPDHLAPGLSGTSPDLDAVIQDRLLSL